MANNCYYYLKAVAKDKAALERLLRVMRAEDAEYFIPGVREANPIDIIHHDNDEGWCEDDECFGWHSLDECEMVAIENAIYASDDYHMEEVYYCLVIKGQVAWNCEEWFSGEDRPKEVIDGGTAHLTSLNVIAKEFGVGIEVWAHEEFYSFQQHFVMNSRGELAVSDTKDWNGYSEAEIMHPDFETRMMRKGRTGLPMNIAIDDGYAYDIQQLPFIQVAFQMDTDEHDNKDNWNAMGLDGTLCDPGVGELQESDLAQLRNFVRNNRYALERVAENDLYSDQIADDLILGGEAASEATIDGLKRKVDEIVVENESRQ